MHALWFCDSKPVETKPQMVGRVYHLQHKIKLQEHEFAEMMYQTEMGLMRSVRKMDTEMSLLEAENAVLREKCDEFE